MSVPSSSDLRDAIIKELMKQIEEGAIKVTKQGEVVQVSVDAPVLTAGINFLKTFPPGNEDVQSDSLSDQLRKYMGENVMPFKGNGNT